MIRVVVPFRNRPDLVSRCLDSLRAQTDQEFWLHVADDASDEHIPHDAIWPSRPDSYLLWHKRVGALRNIVDSVQGADMNPDDVVLIVDGDDWLEPDAIATLRRIYMDPTVDVAYGSYRCASGATGPECGPYPPEVLEAGTVRAWSRDNRFLVNHPLSFRRRLFDAIPDDHYLMPDGEWIRHSYDAVLAMALIELAGTRVHWEPSVLYVYEDRRPDSVAAVHQEEAHAEGQAVYARRPLQPLEVPS